VVALRTAGHRVRLLAPAAPARALLGSGPGEVGEILPCDGPETAAILAGERTQGPLGAALDAADVVVTFTRSEAVIDAFRTRTKRLLAHDPAPPEGGPHASFWLARALAPLEVRPAADSPPPLVFSDDERREARERTRELDDGFLAVHPGSGSAAKNWPAERFAETARRLSGGRSLLLVLGPAEEKTAEWPGAVVAREWPLRVLGAALSRAGLFLGNDSGVAHLAAASGAPTLTLFGPTDPALWAPVGSSVAAVRAPCGALPSLAVETVVAAALALRSAEAGHSSG
jgi:ADP-heptose:LPS heptosyltransferase